MWIALIFTLNLYAGVESSLLLCSEDYWGKLYKLPENLVCKNQSYVEWKISIAKKNIREYESSAESLLILSRTCDTYVNLLGEKSIVKSKRVVSVPAHTAKNLMENHKCIDNDNVEKSTLIENFQCDFKYMEHKSRTTVSCYYSTGVVIATHNESFTSSLSNMEGCNY